jgi:hypothetical protein
MKAHLLFALFVMGGFSAMAQRKTMASGEINFEIPNQYHTVWADTASNPTNVWKIGAPQKTVFTTAYSPSKAIVTNLQQPYTVKDTSSFYIRQRASAGWFRQGPGRSLQLYGWYFADSDSLTDFGTVELSPNNGLNWIDLLKDSTHGVFDQSFVGFDRPVLTGRSGGWRPFEMTFRGIADSFQVQIGDTILMRFTFISDSIQTNRDGLMFDDLQFSDHYLGIDNVSCSRTPFPSAPTPNPASSTIRFALSAKRDDAWRISLYTLRGQKVKTATIPRGAQHELSVADLPAGSYYYTVTGERSGQTSSGSVIIAH